MRNLPRRPLLIDPQLKAEARQLFQQLRHLTEDERDRRMRAWAARVLLERPELAA